MVSKTQRLIYPWRVDCHSVTNGMRRRWSDAGMQLLWTPQIRGKECKILMFVYTAACVLFMYKQISSIYTNTLDERTPGWRLRRLCSYSHVYIRGMAARWSPGAPPPPLIPTTASTCHHFPTNQQSSTAQGWMIPHVCGWMRSSMTATDRKSVV